MRKSRTVYVSHEVENVCSKSSENMIVARYDLSALIHRVAIPYKRNAFIGPRHTFESSKFYRRRPSLLLFTNENEFASVYGVGVTLSVSVSVSVSHGCSGHDARHETL